MKIAIGSKNPAKVKAAKIVIAKLFPKQKVSIIAVDAPSGVSSQPKSDKESIKGAINRAKHAMKKSKSDYAIGMEGGVHRIGKDWYECGWMAVIDKKGNLGIGSTARWRVANKIIKDIMAEKELADVINNLTGRNDVHLKEGVMGLISAGHLPRHMVYVQGLLFAFAPFISDKKFWD